MLIENIDENKFRFFRAKVVDNQDPEKLGRVKVWIPDIMFDFDQNDGLWALPANTYCGGNIYQEQGLLHSGSSMVPRKGDWIWIFFENDNINRPFYLTGVSLEEQPRVPESQIGKEYWNKWILFRSPEGRSIWISDDNSTPDSRVMITGKKKKYDKNNPYNSIYPIVDNQIALVIEEDKINRILLADYNKNYLSINTDKNTIYMYASSYPQNKGKINIFTDKTLIRKFDDGSKGTIVIQNQTCTIKITEDQIEITAPVNIRISNNQSYINIIQGEITICGGSHVTIQAPRIDLNPGASCTPNVLSKEQTEHDQIP